MRYLSAFAGCVVLASASAHPVLTGVWVLDQSHARLVCPATPNQIVMEIEAIAPGSFRVMRITTDAAGHRQLELARRAIEPAASTSRREFVLRYEETGNIETWTVGRHGTLLIQSAPAAVTGVQQDRMVFKPARRHRVNTPKRKEVGL